jgi:hypothetical protein
MVNGKKMAKLGYGKRNETGKHAQGGETERKAYWNWP